MSLLWIVALFHSRVSLINVSPRIERCFTLAASRMGYISKFVHSSLYLCRRLVAFLRAVDSPFLGEYRRSRRPKPYNIRTDCRLAHDNLPSNRRLTSCFTTPSNTNENHTGRPSVRSGACTAWPTTSLAMP